MGSQMFSSPTMRARAALVRGLALVDEMERAHARNDWPAVARLAGQAQLQASAAHAAMAEAGIVPGASDPEPRVELVRRSFADEWLDPLPTDAAPETETEARAAWGDR